MGDCDGRKLRISENFPETSFGRGDAMKLISCGAALDLGLPSKIISFSTSDGVVNDDLSRKSTKSSEAC